MIRFRRCPDVAERQTFAAVLTIEISQCGRQRSSAAKPLGQLHNFFVAVVNRIAQRFLNHRFQQHRRLMLVEQPKLRIDVRFNRKLVKQARTETMNGGDDGAFQRALVTQPAHPLVAGTFAQQRIDLFPHALAHFIRGAVRKSDCDDVVYCDVLRAQNVKIALNQDGSLARARTRSHRKVTLDGVRSRCLFGF